ncbi:MAG: DUF4012 domain-containing protein [Methanosphaera stadtmanae]|jgi:hypothetical protein|nr:DUF4012 domain-containing protein [Methanosphaera stadtmanae]
MVSKKKILLIAIIVILVAIGAYFLSNYQQGKAAFAGEHNILLLCTDPSENRPGIGAVDMAFVVNLKDGHLGNITKVYPGGLTHPTKQPSDSMRAEGLSVVYLHDSLWSENLEEGTKTAQEIVEYHTGLKSDIVMVVTPDAIDALIKAVGPVYSNGEEVKTSSIDFLREDQSENGATRGDAVEGLADGIKEAAQKNGKKPELISTALDQFNKGNIQVVPKEKFSQFITYAGISNVLD